MKHILTIFGLGFVLAGMPTVFAQDEAPSSFRINNIRSEGSGCPLGTVAVNISSDQQAFTLTFSEFFAEVSPTLGTQKDRKACKVIFDTEQESGWEYAVFAVTYRGFAALDAGVRGEQDLRFGTNGKQGRTLMSLIGPYADNYINAQEVPVSALKWSACNINKQKDFAIDATLFLQAPDTSTEGLFTVDTFDGEVRQEYEILWRECNNGPKKFLAVCRLTVPGKDGPFRLISKHRAKKADQALSKAQTKMARKCRDAQGSTPFCEASQAACQVINL